MKLRIHLLRRFAKAFKGLTVEDAENNPQKVVHAALESGARMREDLRDPNTNVSDDLADYVSNEEKQEVLSEIASGDSDLTPRQKAELFDGKELDDEETAELSDIQQGITDRVFGEYQDK